MSNIPGKKIRNESFAVLIVLLVAVATLAFMTYKVDVTSDTPRAFAFAVEHHLEIMAGLVAISLIFGFVSAQKLYTEIQREKQDTKSILAVVLLFLSQEEREIVHFLVEQRGTTTQAEIARLPHMNRVKAHRSLQKMQQKQIIEVVAHGKARKVRLRQNILDLLLEDRPSAQERNP